MLLRGIVMFSFLLLLVSGILGFSPEWNEWIEWKLKYDKTYSSLEDEQQHMEIWLNNLKFVSQHNAKEDVMFSVELNSFADQKISRPKLNNAMPEEVLGESAGLSFAPSSWDWRDKGAVGPVMNQGMLGDNQAFVASDCVSSFSVIHKGGELVETSYFEVHDCCTPTHVASDSVFQCVHNIGGLCSAIAYPSSLGKCGNDTCTPSAQVNGGSKVPAGDESAMMTAVYQTPVMAAIDASHVSFQLYSAGIYTEKACHPNQLDHVLQVVGYGTEKGQDFWICKNSWGVDWGEKGYVKIARNKGNMCGIASFTTYPV